MNWYFNNNLCKLSMYHIKQKREWLQLHVCIPLQLLQLGITITHDPHWLCWIARVKDRKLDKFDSVTATAVLQYGVIRNNDPQ